MPVRMMQQRETTGKGTTLEEQCSFWCYGSGLTTGEFHFGLWKICQRDLTFVKYCNTYKINQSAKITTRYCFFSFISHRFIFNSKCRLFEHYVNIGRHQFWRDDVFVIRLNWNLVIIIPHLKGLFLLYSVM